MLSLLGNILILAGILVAICVCLVIFFGMAVLIIFGVRFLIDIIKDKNASIWKED